ncbi:glycosyltransferase [Macrococcus capreoli]
MTMKQITMFVWNNFTNDARVTREAKALSDHGYKINVICKKEKNEKYLNSFQQYNEGYTAARIYKNEIPQFLLNKIKNPKLNKVFKKHLPNALLMFKMIQQGRKNEADVYHSHDLNTLIQGVICSKLRRDKKILVFDSHEVNTSRTNYNIKIVGIIERLLIKFVDVTIVENDTRAKYHELLYGIKPISLHNYSEYYDIQSVDAIDLYKRYQIPNKKIFLYQGGLQKGRGLDLLIQAFYEANVDAYLFIIGDGKQKMELENQVKALNLNEKVIFTGRVPYEKLRAYTKSAYAGFQILQNINFNHYSASSNKLFEYMMAHVPVIATNMPEIKKVVDTEKIGLIIEDNDINALKNAIITLFENEVLHNEFVQNMKNAKEYYNWENEKKILLDLYAKLFEVK